MPAKKAKKPSPSIRYLLSADRRLQRLSLRKISDRMKGKKPVSRTRRAPGPARTPKPILPSLAIGPGAIVLGLAFAVGAAVLIGARQAAPVAVETNAMNADDAAPTMDAPVEPKPVVTEPAARVAKPAAPVQEVERRVAAEPAKKSPAMSLATSTPFRPAASGPPAAPQTPAPAPAEFARTATSTPVVAEEIPSERSDDEVSSVVTTISGCLGSDGDTFRLKDASGADVPKSRSWKSGFLKKRSVGIVLVDAGRTLHLATYVGQRVAATGSLVDRELRARSVRRLASSCD